MKRKPPQGTNSVIVLIGTKKGLFRLKAGLDRKTWTLRGPLIAGHEIPHAWLDPRETNSGYAAANHVIWGSQIYRTNDAGQTWEPLPSVPYHMSGEFSQNLRALWYLSPGAAAQPNTLYAGIDPAGLFVSHDCGHTWQTVPGFNHHPTRDKWEPARGGFAAHSIYLDPMRTGRMFAAVSAGGAFRSEDNGKRWVPINKGVRAENLPHGDPEVGHNIHRLVMHPQHTARLYRQCYNGTYRSDDAGDTWTEITAGLPSDFGYGIEVDPHDPDMVFVIPEESSHMRATVDGKLRVYRSRNAGENWQPLTTGLPQEHVYVTVLREALATDQLDPCGVYFGTSGGHFFVSRDAGDSWALVVNFLPRILSVKAAVVRDGE